MKKHLYLCVFFLLAFLSLQAQSLNRSFYAYTLTTDTLTDDTTLTFGSGYLITDLYDLSWQVELDSISGTPAGTVYLEGSNCSACDDWSAYSSFSITATSAQDTTFVVTSFPFLRARVRIAGTGTQSQEVRNHIRWMERKR